MHILIGIIVVLVTGFCFLKPNEGLGLFLKLVVVSIITLAICSVAVLLLYLVDWRSVFGFSSFIAILFGFGILLGGIASYLYGYRWFRVLYDLSIFAGVSFFVLSIFLGIFGQSILTVYNRCFWFEGIYCVQK